MIVQLYKIVRFIIIIIIINSGIVVLFEFFGGNWQVKMASSVEKEGSAAVRDAGASEERVWLDLPAPSGWTKKVLIL